MMHVTGWEPLRGRRPRLIEVVSELPNPPASRPAGTPKRFPPEAHGFVGCCPERFKPSNENSSQRDALSAAADEDFSSPGTMPSRISPAVKIGR